jgi:hypothetical protein
LRLELMRLLETPVLAGMAVVESNT